MIGCAIVVSVSASYSIYYNFASSSQSSYVILPHVLYIVSSFTPSIYSVDTILYPYALPLIQSPLTSLKSLPKCNLSSSLRL